MEHHAAARRRAVAAATTALVGVAVVALTWGVGAAGAQSRSEDRTGTTGRSGYVVRPGDTVAAIARRTGVDPEDLRAANGIVGDRLYAGARLVIDRNAAPAGGTAPRGPRILCPVRGARYMNDWGFPRGPTRFHEGTDLFAPRGTTVTAPITGTLVFGSNPLGGRTFTITSPSGWVAYGAHLATTSGTSRWVAAGDVVGTVGDTGNARGGPTHLHLGLRRGAAAATNPYPSVAAAC